LVSACIAVPGSELAEGDDLMELTTDKAAFVVPAPMAGRLVAWRVAEGDTVTVGAVICEMDALSSNVPIA
jgi:pyruvate/2-oxoglutarate dehydrogenase complex dihydrolipoamide acyltransferase (E2) component